MALRMSGLLLVSCMLAGCGTHESIRHYEVVAPIATTSAFVKDVPEGWLPGQLVISRGGVQVRRDAAYEVRDGDKRAEITVTSLPAEGNSNLANVNRWRQQLQLEPMSESQLQQAVTKIQMGDLAADYVQLAGAQESILGVMALRQGTVWFIKLQGHSDLAKREQARFEQFVKSLPLK